MIDPANVAPTAAKGRRGPRPVPQRRRLCGQSLTEYVILCSLIGGVLVIGEPSPLESLVRAIQSAYGRHVMALSLP